jgi:hypothetical protein
LLAGRFLWIHTGAVHSSSSAGALRSVIT